MCFVGCFPYQIEVGLGWYGVFARWSSSRELELQYPYQTSSRSIQPVASIARPLCVFTNLAIFQSLMILCKDYKARPAQASGVVMTHI